MKSLEWAFLGMVPYKKAWKIQKELRIQRIQNKIPDTLLLLEHPPTITMGRHRGEKSLLHTVESIEKQGVQVIRSDRGGDATAHSPGQLVGYLIVHLEQNKTSLPKFIADVARALICFLEDHHVDAIYDPRYPGIWKENNKIAAFGFHLDKAVTMHGFAINLHNDLSLFDLIVPCGLASKGVTSLSQWNPSCPEPRHAALRLAENIAREINLTIKQSTTHYSKES